jgi:antitoxin component YwqK of YwqJK toxin-antitoxin module
MKTTILVFILTCFYLSAFAQEKIYNYYTSYWTETTKEKATYYRTVEKFKKQYVIRSYYISGKRQMDSVICSTYKPKLEFEGTLSVYHENGTVKQKGFFKNERPNGLHQFWYPYGTLHKEVMYSEGGKSQVLNFFSSTGEQLVKEGTGISLEETSYGKSHFIQWRAGKNIGMFSLENSDTVYILTEQQAEYKGGLAAFMQVFSENLKFPRSESGKPMDGKVFVRLMVDEKGRSHYHHVIEGISQPFNDEAIRVSSLLQNWIPGSYNGRIVKSWFVVPVYFRSEK